MLLLLGRCGLERLAEPLRALGHEGTGAAPGDRGLIEALKPELVYVDLFSDLFSELPLDPDLFPPGTIFRGPRLPTSHSPLTGRPTIDPLALWARHGILNDAVRFGPGHGEAEHGPLGCSRLDGRDAGEIEAQALHARWHARTRGPRKCVVVDLDDTLIHGRIAAEDFTERNPAWGGQLPEEESFWRAPRGLHFGLRELRGRGLLLALATRNDPALLPLFKRRPGPVLAPLLDLDDFVAVAAGFGEKSAMLRQIAADLGIGTDSLAFVDDSAFEREEVRAALPEVLVFDSAAAGWQLPEAPELWSEAPLSVHREQSYRSRVAVTAAADPLAFLSGLGLRATVRPALPEDLPRVRELFQRSNQLALTAQRPQPDSTAGLYVGLVHDRLADHGLVAAALFGSSPHRLLAFACSCRVLPHRVAPSLLHAMLQLEPGAQAAYEPTPRNGASGGLLEEASLGIAPWLALSVTP